MQDAATQNNNLIWLVDHLRLTAFPIHVVDQNAVIRWQELTGESPENVQSKPRMKTLLEEGPYQKGRLLLSMEPKRCDWRYMASSPFQERELIDALPDIGELSDAVDVFRPPMLQWLKNAPPIQRLAFGTVLLQPVESHEIGYRQLNDYLPKLELDPNSSDFSYTINRPRKSTIIQDLKINRLSKWNVLRLALTGQQPSQVLPLHVACRLELDINSDALYHQELPKEKLTELFDELIALAKEIASKGDQP